jgi:hypothetical protein
MSFFEEEHILKYWPILLPLVLLTLAIFGVILALLFHNAGGVA